jgi:hypothetical protein
MLIVGEQMCLIRIRIKCRGYRQISRAQQGPQRIDILRFLAGGMLGIDELQAEGRRICCNCKPRCVDVGSDELYAECIDVTPKGFAVKLS